MLIAQSAIDCQCPHCHCPPTPLSLSSPFSYLLFPSLAHSQLIAEHFIWPPNRYLRSDHKYFPALISMRLHCCLSPNEDFRTYFILGVAGATSHCLLFGGQAQPEAVNVAAGHAHVQACAGFCRPVRACACMFMLAQ